MIQINEAELRRAGFPVTFIAALRQIAQISNSSVTTADINNLQNQLDSVDIDLQQLEQRIAMNVVRSQLADVSQAVEYLRAEMASKRQPDLSSITSRLDALEILVHGAL